MQINVFFGNNYSPNIIEMNTEFILRIILKSGLYILLKINIQIPIYQLFIVKNYKNS